MYSNSCSIFAATHGCARVCLCCWCCCCVAAMPANIALIRRSLCASPWLSDHIALYGTGAYPSIKKCSHVGGSTLLLLLLRRRGHHTCRQGCAACTEWCTQGGHSLALRTSLYRLGFPSSLPPRWCRPPLPQAWVKALPHAT